MSAPTEQTMVKVFSLNTQPVHILALGSNNQQHNNLLFPLVKIFLPVPIQRGTFIVFDGEHKSQ